MTSIHWSWLINHGKHQDVILEVYNTLAITFDTIHIPINLIDCYIFEFIVRDLCFSNEISLSLSRTMKCPQLIEMHDLIKEDWSYYAQSYRHLGS